MHLEKDDMLNFINTGLPIRVGCSVSFFNKEQKKVMSGEVYVSEYVKKDKSKHVFIIKRKDKSLTAIDAVSLYACLLNHIPGEESKKDTK